MAISGRRPAAKASGLRRWAEEVQSWEGEQCAFGLESIRMMGIVM